MGHTATLLTTVQRIGTSLYVCVTAPIAKLAGLKKGDRMVVWLRGDTLVMRRLRLEQMTPPPELLESAKKRKGLPC